MFDADTFAQGTPEPFRLTFTIAGQSSLDAAAQWLEQHSSLGFEASERLYTRFDEEMARLCQRFAEGFRPLPDENASLYFSRPTFQLIIRTGQRSRLNNSGVWRVFYDVLDTDGDGKPDTLRVLAVRHGAMQPLWQEGTGDGDEEAQTP